MPQTQYIIYTNENCPKCTKQKEEWKKNGTVFEERDSERIKVHQDKYDIEALIEASMQNMELPVIIKIQ